MAELIDNRRRRIETLKQIITRLHEGAEPDEVRQQLEEIVKETDASEIAAMEQQLMEEGMTVEQIMGMCDLHSQVVGGILTERPCGPVVPGHPAETFRRENEALKGAIDRVRAGLADGGERLAELHLACNDLMDIEKHYSRKENLLFPILERHGIVGPSKVMWGKDDEVRQLLKGVEAKLAEGIGSPEARKEAGEEVFAPALAAVEEMIRKETEILLPMALDALTEAEWGEIWEQSPEIGYCLVEPGDEYAPQPAADPNLLAIEGSAEKKGAAFVAPTGSLNVEQLKGLFAVLPVDVTFVDADDRVRYFSEGPKRVFERTRAIIGRKVQNCHPPSSVAIVEQILDDFRTGRQDSCSFWIELHGRFVQIRYFAVRDAEGSYMGTVEVTQDLTEARALEGERRLLEYDSPPEPQRN